MAQLHKVSGALAIVTAQSLIAAPQAKWRIKVRALVISIGATACTVTIGFSATNQRVYQFGANGGVNSEIMDWEGDAATALTVTTSANGPTQITIDYEIEEATF